MIRGKANYKHAAEELIPSGSPSNAPDAEIPSDRSRLGEWFEGRWNATSLDAKCGWVAWRRREGDIDHDGYQ